MSRIQLNPQRRGARHLLSSPQRLHAAVLGCFPAPPTGDRDGAARVLWRVDHDRERTLLYVVSPSEPDFAALAEDAGWPTTERGVVKPYQPLLDTLESGQTWAFRLTANPTRYLPGDDGRARRVAHVTVGHQEQWLRDRVERAGFRIAGESNLLVSRRNVETFTRRDTTRARTGTVTVAIAQFDGLLEVTDPQLLRTALVTGIGPAKAYGCGLLTLARTPA